MWSSTLLNHYMIDQLLIAIKRNVLKISKLWWQQSVRRTRITFAFPLWFPLWSFSLLKRIDSHEYDNNISTFKDDHFSGIRPNIRKSWNRFMYNKPEDNIKMVNFLSSSTTVIQYVGLCVFSLPISFCDDWDNIYTLSYYHHQIESMNYNPLFRVMSWNNGMRCMSFYILMVSILSNKCNW